MVEPGSEAAPERFHMTITAGGPYLVFGHPPLRQQFMLPNRDGEIWYFQAGEKYSTESEPTALCRCGHSGDKPYCDGLARASRLGSFAGGFRRTAARRSRAVRRAGSRLDGQSRVLRLRPVLRCERTSVESGQHGREAGPRPDGSRSRPLPCRQVVGVDRRTGASRTAFRAVARLDRGSSAGQQRSALGSGRHSVQSRGRIYLRSAEPGYPVPLRPVVEQAFLRRVARFDPFSGRTAFPSRSRRRTLVAGTRETGAHGNEENFPCAFL